MLHRVAAETGLEVVIVRPPLVYGSGVKGNFAQMLREAMGHPARLFPCPVALLELAGQLSGRVGQIERLTGSLRVDSGKICRELGWQPPCSLREGLRATVG